MDSIGPKSGADNSVPPVGNHPIDVAVSLADQSCAIRKRRHLLTGLSRLVRVDLELEPL